MPKKNMRVKITSAFNYFRVEYPENRTNRCTSIRVIIKNVIFKLGLKAIRRVKSKEEVA